jgi:hypothetical protein
MYLANRDRIIGQTVVIRLCAETFFTLKPIVIFEFGDPESSRRWLVKFSYLERCRLLQIIWCVPDRNKKGEDRWKRNQRDSSKGQARLGGDLLGGSKCADRLVAHS